MPTTYVLINCRLGEEARIIRELRKVKGVADAHGVYGIYDVIVEVRGAGVRVFDITKKHLKRTQVHCIIV
jgi:DNA-binding Lrp family transcriptional regulator